MKVMVNITGESLVAYKALRKQWGVPDDVDAELLVKYAIREALKSVKARKFKDEVNEWFGLDN